MDVVDTPITREYAGQTYTFTPFTPMEWSEFARWYNAQEGARPTHIVPLEKLVDGAQSVDGMLWICWRAARDAHPTLKLADLGRLIPFGELVELALEMMALPEPEPVVEGSDPPAPSLIGSS